MRKLAASGIHPRIVKVLHNWLRDRAAVVVVNGVSSSKRILANNVYQGTVWRPPLWNIFYRDAPASIACHDCQETVYADDLNAFRAFDVSHSNADIIDKIHAMKKELHEWGAQTQFCLMHRKKNLW